MPGGYYRENILPYISPMSHNRDRKLIPPIMYMSMMHIGNAYARTVLCTAQRSTITGATHHAIMVAVSTSSVNGLHIDDMIMTITNKKPPHMNVLSPTNIAVSNTFPFIQFTF